MSHSASRVAGTNRTQVPIVPAVPPLLPSLSKTALLSLLPSVLISSRTHRRRAAAAGKPQAAVDYGLVRSDPTPSTVSRPAPTARKPRPSWSVSPSQVSRGPSINSVPPMPIQHATDAINPAPPCLVPSGQRHLGMSVPQPLSPRCHHRQKSSSSSVSSDTRTPIGRMNNAPSQFVTPPSGMLFSEVPRSSPTISLFTWRLTNAARCRKCVL